MPKHTRGQWEVNIFSCDLCDDEWFFTIYKQQGKQCIELARGSNTEAVSKEEMQANARLMADAPRMLELFQKLYFAYINKGEERDREFELETLEEYRQLMAKHGYNPFKYELLKGEKSID